MSGGAREKALQYLLQHRINVVAVVTPLPTAANSRFQGVIDVAQDYGVQVKTVDRNGVYQCLKGLDFDILLSCGFTFIIDQQTIDLAKEVALNVHPTLLPKYRGYRSGPYIVINGEKESGVTVHQLIEDMDKGGILLQESFPLTDFDTTKSVMFKTQELEPNLIYKAIQLIESGSYHFTAQDESKASEYSNLRTPKDSEVDPNKSLDSLYNEIRACDPEDYPAFFYRGEEKVYIKLWTHRSDKEEGEI